jgi:phage tail P2-like protein
VTEPALLPNNRTPLEAALEGANAARFPLPTELVASVWNPDTCPADLLPYLAWGLSVDLWDNNWQEATKREVCRKALALHRLKTTPAGIKAHVKVAGAEVLKIVRPPAREFRRGAMTDAQRAAWLDSLPQVRIYPFSEVPNPPLARSFFSGPGGKQFFGYRDSDVELDITDEDGNPLGGTSMAAETSDTPPRPLKFLRTSRGFFLRGRRATFYDQGVEVPITYGTTDDAEVERVYLRRTAPNRMFFGSSFIGHGWVRATAAETNTITVQFSDDVLPFPVPPSMDPVNVRPQRIAQGRTAPLGRGFLLKRKRFGGFMKASHGPLMIYDRVALNDPTRTGKMRKVRSFHGRGRYGIDAFTAELQICVPMQRKRRTAGRWHGAGYRKSADMTPLWRAIEAVRVSKAFRDTVHINTTTKSVVKFGSGLTFGEFVFGQIKEVN